MSEHEPLIALLLCRWSAAAPSQNSSMNGHRRVSVPVVCAGNVHPSVIVNALTTGCDGVLLAACAHGGCHYPEGNDKAQARAEAITMMLEDLGVEPERFRFELLEGPDDPRLETALSELTETLLALGPSPYA
jgi:F420-non-reducing hydrogenase iron-sulfur subunit